MKFSPFIDRSRMLIKSWFFFIVAWGIITFIQFILGYEHNGYSTLFKDLEKSSYEIFWALFCLVLYPGWWISEIFSCHKVMREYKDFVKSITKTRAIKEILYRLKVTLFIIMVGLGFSIIAGMLHTFNYIVVVLLMLIKLYFICKYKKLLSLMRPEEIRGVSIYNEVISVETRERLEEEFKLARERIRVAEAKREGLIEEEVQYDTTVVPIVSFEWKSKEELDQSEKEASMFESQITDVMDLDSRVILSETSETTDSLYRKLLEEEAEEKKK